MPKLDESKNPFAFLLKNKDEECSGNDSHKDTVQESPTPTPTLESFVDFTGFTATTEPTPPPVPNKNNPQEYDRNHWSRLLNNSTHLAPNVRHYLVVMYNAGVKLVERKVKAANGKVIVKLKFIPGVDEGWKTHPNPGQMLRELMTGLYTYILQEEAAGRNQGDKPSPALSAINAALEAKGCLTPCAPGQAGIAGFRLDWSKVGSDAKSQEKLAQARTMLDQAGGDVKRCIEGVAAAVRELGCVVALTEMAEVEDVGESKP